MTETYQFRKEKNLQESVRLEKRFERLGWLRLFCFLGLALLVTYSFQLNPGLGIGALLVSSFAFISLVLHHRKVLSQAAWHRALSEVNAKELEIGAYQFQNVATGESFMDEEHPCAADLDLFGERSLFQYINRASTEMGQHRMAEWLLAAPAPYAEVLARTEASKELAPDLEWRQKWQAEAKSIPLDRESVALLLKWLKEPAFLENRSWLVLAIHATPLVMLPLVTLYALGWLPWIAVFIPLLIVGQLWRMTSKQINELHLHTHQAQKPLSVYVKLFKLLEEKEVRSPLLKHFKEQLCPRNSKKSSEAVEQLAWYVSQLDARFNIFSIVFNALGLWDLQWAFRLERWKSAHRANLGRWLEVVQDMEALMSIATLRYNHPDWANPEMKLLPETAESEAVNTRYAPFGYSNLELPVLSDNEPMIEALGIGHPLIASTKRIGNDFNVPRIGHIHLVTGSNMGGKSTFLRAVGVNLVLAGMGAPVCATKLKTPLLAVYTSMRTRDALRDETSSFFAELKRLKQVITAVESTENVFFLLDEVLKGTNFRDQHLGTEALLKQLVKANGTGLMATHDLEIGSLAESFPDRIRNVCFEVETDGDHLIFDYKMRHGVTQSFNATQLMRRMGIKI